MLKIEAMCSIVKSGGRIIGVSLIAEPQTEAERFCNSLPVYLLLNEAYIAICDGKITFIRPGEGEVLFTIKDEDAIELRGLMESGKKLIFYHDGILTRGFKLVLEGSLEDEEERVELERV